MRRTEMTTDTALASVSNVTQAQETQSVWLSRAFTASRLVLGAILVFAVTNAIFKFAPQPPVPEAALTFLGGLFSAPYFFGLLKGTELVVALALLSNRFVPL